MSRTFRRLDEFGLQETADWAIDPDGYYRRVLGFTEAEMFYRRHTDNHRSAYGPNRDWKRESHKKNRAHVRDQIRKIMIDPEHDFVPNLKDHGLDLWDWY